MREDNRKCRRYPFHAIAALHSTSEGSRKTVTTLINNISYSGMGLISYTPIQKGTPVSVKMIKIKGSGNNDRVTGTIAWSYKHDKFYHMGLSFNDELHPDRQPILCEHFFRTIRYN